MPEAPHDFLRFLPLMVVLYAAIVFGSIRASRRLVVPLPPQQVPWSWVEILLAFVLGQYIWRYLIFYILSGAGVLESMYGQELVKAAMDSQASPARTFALTRIFLFVGTIALPFELASTILLVRWGSNTSPDQLGLTVRRFVPNVQLGVLTLIVATPVVYLVLATTQRAVGILTPGTETEHPFTLASRNLSDVEMILLTFLAVIRAAVLEELFFRGLMQPWLAQFSYGGHIAMGLAFFRAAWLSPKALDHLLYGPDWNDRLGAAMPMLFVLALLPTYLVVCRVQKTAFPSALFGTALLFGMFHDDIWPTPVPLFVLALALGWLAQRTQSLVGPMVVHGLFNGISCLQIWTLRGGG